MFEIIFLLEGSASVWKRWSHLQKPLRTARGPISSTALVFPEKLRPSEKKTDPVHQATCRAGVQLAHSGRCTDLSTNGPTCPTSCPEMEGKVVPTPFNCSPVPVPRKRWCAAVTGTATRASAKCGDGRAVKGSRWRTTRTVKPQSEPKK